MMRNYSTFKLLHILKLTVIHACVDYDDNMMPMGFGDNFVKLS